MTTTPTGPSIPQGDPRLLATPAARDLLTRPIPARVAYVAHDGTPRVVPTWFHWDGEAIVMATWLSGPHIHHPARRVRDLQQRPEVAISIDTEDAVPTALQIRGRAVVEEVDAVVTEYRLSAERYLGAEAAGGMLGELEGAPVSMARISVRPEWVGLVDFAERLPGPLGGVR